MKKKATLHPFLKMAGVKTEKEFYSKYPSDEDFFAAHPKARYGIAMAQNGAVTPPGQGEEVNLPATGVNPWQATGQGINPQDVATGLNAAGPMPEQGAYAASQGPVYDNISDQTQQGNEEDTSLSNSNNTPPPGGKKPKGKRSYKVSVGDKTWNPFAKDNAWNTGQGVATTDMIAGGLGMVAGALPFQPAKQNKNVLQPAVTQGNYGQGSQASFENGGNISPTKAREMLHNPPHGKDLTEKQRRYFGAIASGYAADGGPMITNVPPSPYTYFRPMTKTNRQKMDMPNYEGSNIPVAQDGWASGIPGVGAYQAPVTDQERKDWNRYQAAMKRQPGTYVRNWQHNQDFQKQMAQQTGFDYNRAGAIQADMQARSQSIPGSVTGIEGSDPWGGDPNWVGDREIKKAYMEYQYVGQTFNPKTGKYEEYYNSGAPQLTPKTEEQFAAEAAAARGGRPVQQSSENLGSFTTSPGSFDSTSSLVGNNSVVSKTKGFPTMEQAKAAHAKKKAGIETRWNPNTSEYEEIGKANKAVASTDNLGPGEEAYSIDAVRRTGKGSDEAKYGKEMIPGMYHPDHDMEMMDAYPHKMGRMYRPYDHTYMAQGGYIPMGEQGLQVEGNQYRYLSPQTIELVGPKHKDGGIDIAYNGNMVEAEGGETFHVDNKGMWSGGNMAAAGTSMNSGIVGGNLYTSPELLEMADVKKGKMKYKDFFADVIAPRERKALKMKDKITKLSDNLKNNNKYEAPVNGTIKAKSDAISQYESDTANIKDYATNEQNQQLQMAEQFGIEPKDLNKQVGYAKWGKKMAQRGIQINGIGKQRMGYIDDNQSVSNSSEQNESLAKRNNNPGNIRFVPNSWMTRMGAVKGDGGFAKFPDIQTGLQAIQTQLKRPLYKNLDVDKAIKQWTNGTGYKNIDLSEFKGKKIDDLSPDEINRLTDKITVGEDAMNYGVGQKTNKNSPSIKLDYKIRPDEFDPNMDPGIAGDYPTPKPYEFDPSKSGVIPEPEHPAWGYKPDGTKMTPEEMQKNLTDRKKGEKKPKGKGIREKHYLDSGAVRDAFEQPDPYQSMQVQPYLEPDYNISLQQKKNAIQSAYAPAINAAKTPAQKAAITAQMAEQLGAVDTEEFGINQENRAGILARNLGEMRGVRDTNLKLAMDAYEKGLGAKEAARQIRRHGEEKLFSDWRATDALNRQLAMQEQYAGWQQDPDGKWHMLRPANIYEQRTASLTDLSGDEQKRRKNTKNWAYDPTTGKKIQETSEQQTDNPTAYFGDYLPGIQRVYFAGGAVGGGMGHGGMHGMPGQQGSMASRYSPGGDTSYYEKKKKRKKVS